MEAVRRILAVLAVAGGAIVLAACTSSTPSATGSLKAGSTAHTTSPTGSAPSTTAGAPPTSSAQTPTAGSPPCTAQELRFTGWRSQGENMGANVMVELTNTGPGVCALDQAPSAVSLIGASGTATTFAGVSGSGHNALTVRPGAAVGVGLYWASWCSGVPGPQQVRLVLPAGGGTVESPPGTPPAIGYVPPCTASGQPSTLQFIDVVPAGSG